MRKRVGMLEAFVNGRDKDVDKCCIDDRDLRILASGGMEELIHQLVDGNDCATLWMTIGRVAIQLWIPKLLPMVHGSMRRR